MNTESVFYQKPLKPTPEHGADGSVRFQLDILNNFKQQSPNRQAVFCQKMCHKIEMSNSARSFKKN